MLNTYRENACVDALLNHNKCECGLIFLVDSLTSFFHLLKLVFFAQWQLAVTDAIATKNSQRNKILCKKSSENSVPKTVHENTLQLTGT